jgi:hypothetical protein
MTTRYQDWEERLAVYLDRKADERFQHGTHDCALFAAGAVLAMTGFDPAAALRGQYDTAAGAARALREFGEGTLLRTIQAAFPDEVCPHQAQRGDVVMLNRTTAGICVGHFSYFVGHEQGQDRLTHIPTAQCQRAFRVPYE